MNALGYTGLDFSRREDGIVNTAVLVAVGDELLSGVRREGNCAWLAWILHDAGWRLLRMEVVPDDLPEIVGALERWVGKTDLLVLSGGLGPTHDDKTRYALAEYLDCGLTTDDALYDRVAARYEETSQSLHGLSESGNFPQLDMKTLVERSRPTQSLVPTVARGVYNPAGSALGIYFERSGTRVWSFPGVPFEYKAMVKQEVTPFLSSAGSGAWASVSVIGVPESLAVERVPEIVTDERLHVSVLPSFGLVEFVIRGERALVESAVHTLRERFAGDVLPEDCVTLPEAILATGQARSLTLPCAESCTGGLIGAALTDIAGSSAVFAGSAVVYSNEAKKNLLGVEASILSGHGAVSGECAESMAKGALTRYGTSLAVAVTGVAGPDGGSLEKPIGTVWFGVALQGTDQVISDSFVRRLDGERDLVRERAVRVALTAAWRKMCEM
jgi:nicotinamide-nucleotide amidase